MRKLAGKTHLVVVLVAIIVIAGAVGSISGIATMVKARKLLPRRPKFPANGDKRLRNISFVLFGLAGVAFVVAMVGLITLLNTPTEKVHHSTYVILLVGLGFTFALLLPASALYGKSFNYDGPRYTVTGREKPPRHPRDQRHAEPHDPSQAPNVLPGQKVADYWH
jgi:MFS family permease